MHAEQLNIKTPWNTLDENASNGMNKTTHTP